MTVNERIAKLRKLMLNLGIDAYIVPTNDFHGSEYVGEYFKARKFITGFSGSAGTAVIFAKEEDGAGLWTDGRYFLQAGMELKGSCVELFKMSEPDVPKLTEHLAKMLKNGGVIGFDGRTISQSFMDELAEAMAQNAKTYSVKSADLIDEIWEDRPALSCEKAEIFDVKYAGLERSEKLYSLKKSIKEKGGDMFVMTSLDDIAWLLNIRGNDVECNPVVLSYLVVDSCQPILFAQSKAIGTVAEALRKDGVIICEYNEVYDYIAKNCRGKNVILDKNKANYEILQSASGAAKVIDVRTYTVVPKHIKNPTEVEGMVYAHLKDGVAKTKWIYWLKKNVGKLPMDEISVADKLFELCSMQDNNRGNSFEPIMGYGPHGAIIHYSATKESASKLEAKGLLLADTGGQYLEGTTDVTRTIALGDLTDEEKRDYTLVLRGHLALQGTGFEYGKTGSQLDLPARAPLQAVNMDYNHGTGHGVGVYLNVHEDPVRITHASVLGTKDIVFEEGMISSDEPGIYIEGKHGVRIENLIVCLKDEEATKKSGKQMMKFEPLTLIPYEREAVDLSQMNAEEIKWYNDYQSLVYEKISPYLEEDEKAWLKEATMPL